MVARMVLIAGVALVVTAGVVGAGLSAGPIMGPANKTSRPAFHGVYDGHKVTYLNTDVSSKADAAAMHINYSARIGQVKGLPEIYLVQGKAAAGQLAVFGSEPGEKDYSPLWSETILTWKAVRSRRSLPATRRSTRSRRPASSRSATHMSSSTARSSRNTDSSLYFV